jgi:hypothetical protein
MSAQRIGAGPRSRRAVGQKEGLDFSFFLINKRVGGSKRDEGLVVNNCSANSKRMRSSMSLWAKVFWGVVGLVGAGGLGGVAWLR